MQQTLRQLTTSISFCLTIPNKLRPQSASEYFVREFASYTSVWHVETRQLVLETGRFLGLIIDQPAIGRLTQWSACITFLAEVIMRNAALTSIFAGQVATVPGGFGYMKLTGMAGFGLALYGATYSTLTMISAISPHPVSESYENSRRNEDGKIRLLR